MRRLEFCQRVVSATLEIRWSAEWHSRPGLRDYRGKEGSLRARTETSVQELVHKQRIRSFWKSGSPSETHGASGAWGTHVEPSPQWGRILHFRECLRWWRGNIGTGSIGVSCAAQTGRPAVSRTPRNFVVMRICPRKRQGGQEGLANMFLPRAKPEVRPAWERIEEADHVLLLLDFDGTLAPLQQSPQRVELPPMAREQLCSLARNPRVTPAVFSGRSIEDLVGRVGVERLVYVGNHGNEIRGRGVRFVEPIAFLSEPALRQLVSCLAPQLDALPHVCLENKRLTATLHMRDAPLEERAEAAGALLYQVGLSTRFRARAEHQCYDILPLNGWDKGAAALWLQRELGLAEAVVIYAGDGVSDEDAFAALADQITVKVGRAPTCANYAVDSPEQICALLEQLEHSTSRVRWKRA